MQNGTAPSTVIQEIDRCKVRQLVWEYRAHIASLAAVRGDLAIYQMFRNADGDLKIGMHFS